MFITNFMCTPEHEMLLHFESNNFTRESGDRYYARIGNLLMDSGQVKPLRTQQPMRKKMI